MLVKEILFYWNEPKLWSLFDGEDGTHKFEHAYIKWLEFIIMGAKNTVTMITIKYTSIHEH